MMNYIYTFHFIYRQTIGEQFYSKNQSEHSSSSLLFPDLHPAIEC